MKTLSLAVAIAVLVLACSSDESEVSGPQSATIIVKNFRPDTLSKMLRQTCSPAQTDTAVNDLGGNIMPNANYSVTVDPGCYTLRFLNPRDSLVDSRPATKLNARDTVIVRLVR